MSMAPVCRQQQLMAAQMHAGVLPAMAACARHIREFWRSWLTSFQRQMQQQFQSCRQEHAKCHCKMGVRWLCNARKLGCTSSIERLRPGSLTCLARHRGEALGAAACARGPLAGSRGGQRRARPLRAWDPRLVPSQSALHAAPSSSALARAVPALLGSCWQRQAADVLTGFEDV